jgi:antitoxin (DNA-binding transcriptional repressor) of toxin-antitoxin stability system
MGQAVSITEVSRHFSDYLNRVAYRGECFVLLRGKKALAELVPAPKGRRLGDLPELLRSLPSLTKGETDAFLKDIQMVKSRLAKRKLRDPWVF